jgi:ankyrin repeat protein
MKKIFKAGILFCLFLGLMQYSSAFGEIEFFEIAGTGSVNEVRAVLGIVSDINAKDNNGMTALMWAAWKNPNLEVIKIIIDAGADVSIKDNSGNTALDYAKKDLNYTKLKSEFYKLLWTKDVTLSKDSFFVELCGSGTASEVINAIKGGANVNAMDRYGISPIFWAAWLNSDVQVVSALLKSGANPNTVYGNGLTPLIIAAGENQNPEVVAALLDGGADPKKQDTSGKKAIDYAEGNRALKGTKAYLKLKEVSSEPRSQDRSRP